jgi:Zn-dependent protease/CBS domain-containing protein
MGWSFRLTRVAGIDINIHLTFLLLLPFGALSWGDTGGAAGALFGVLMIILLFVFVTLHELGHALAAKALGIPVKEIQLLPIGGVAVLGKPVTRAIDELVIAAAGPLVNVLGAVGLAVIAAGVGLFDGLSANQIVSSVGAVSVVGAVLWLIQANLMLVLFNMIPAFPMDGGRILRAGIALITDRQRATAIAGAVGQGIAILMGVYGLMSGNLLLAAIAVFIFLGARQEVAAAQVLGTLQGVKAGDIYVRGAASLEIGQRLNDAADLMLATRQYALPVLQGERLLGIVTRDQVQAARAAGRGEAWVTAAMQRDVARVAPEDAVEAVQGVMMERRTPVVAVFDGEQFLGLLSVEEINAAYTLGARGQDRQQPASGASGAD